MNVILNYFMKSLFLLALNIILNQMKRTVHKVELPADFAQKLLDNEI